jgi:alcohol dehydrogenase
MGETSRAMVFEGPGRPLVARDFALPRLAAGELLVEITCATICGSDLHTYQGRRETPCPTILGHEMLGRVVALPAGDLPVDWLGRPLAIGDRVTWSIAASCGGCFYCRHDLPQKCQTLFKYGHERIDPRHPLSGGLAEHCHLAAGTTVLHVPDAVADRVACPANCATATVAAALRVAGDCRGATLLIQGAGMLGLTAAAMASTAGAREILVCDPDPRRLARAADFGATRAVPSSDGAETLAQAVERLTDGRGVDVALELSGAPEAIETGVRLLRIGGRYVLVGAVFPTRPVALSAEWIVRRLLRIEGVHNYVPADLARAVEFLSAAGGRFPFADLVAGPFPLAESEAAFQHALATRAARVAIVPG